MWPGDETREQEERNYRGGGRTFMICMRELGRRDEIKVEKGSGKWRKYKILALCLGEGVTSLREF